MSLSVGEALETRIAVLQTLATSMALHAGNVAIFRPRAETVLREQFPGAVIEVVTEDGREIMNTALPPDAPTPIRPSLEWLQQVFATGRPVVSDLYQNAIGPQPVAAIDVPVKADDGTVLYVVSLHPRLEVFADIIRRQNPPASWVVSVFDRRGVVIARVPNGGRFVGHEAAPSFLGPLQSAREGVVNATSLEGVRMLSAFSHGEKFGWAVAIGVPRTELTGPIVSRARNTLAVGAALLAIALALALYAARGIARPIESLRRLAAATDREALPEPAPTGLLEVDEVARALHTAEDERRRSRQAEVVLRDGIETIPEGFAIYDDEDRLAICNESYRRLFPSSPESVVPGARFEDILRAGLGGSDDAEIKGHEEEWVNARVREHRDPDIATEQRLADGHWVLVRNRRLSNGGIGGLRVDITARKQAEETLRASEEQLNRAQRLAHIGSICVSLQTDETDWSDEVYRIFDLSRETFVPSRDNYLRTVHPDDRATVHTIQEQVRMAINPRPTEYRIIRSDGTVRWIYRESELIQDEAGDPLYVNSTIQDITDRHRTEEQLRQSQKMEAIGNLTGGMAHDFNNLLGVIVGNLGLARQRIGSDAELQELVDEALEAAWHGADLTRRLLAFARRQPLRPARIDINELVGNTVRLLRRMLGEDIDVSLDLAEHVWPVMADPAQLEASVTNLATNARDAMPKGGRLIISTANGHLDAEYTAAHVDVTPGDFAMIEVSDTGSGMSAETLNQIFEPFFTTKEPGKGTGLGLSMVFGFMRQSGGHVNVYSEPGVGTTFRLYLPRVAAEASEREVRDATPATAHGAGETVLVVEDNPAVRRVVMRQLRDLGYCVLECDRAAAALEILQRKPVDLLFTDIVMPGGLDGVELARLARERWPALKVVLTSGFPQVRVNSNGDVLGDLQLLNKPYSKEELAAVLRAALSLSTE
jgi:PAS domain S-box-containing protein